MGELEDKLITALETIDDEDSYFVSWENNP